MDNPFPKLTAEARRHPEDKALLNELGAFLTMRALHKPTHSKKYDFYEYLEEKGDKDEGENGP